MRRIALLLTLLLWFVPAPVGAEKSKPLIFEIDSTLNQPRYVLSPLPSEFVKAKPTPQPKAPNPKTTRKISTGLTKSEKSTDRSTTKFKPGYCTDYVAQKVKVTWRGNANRWLNNAKAQGYQVDRNPTAGSILVTNEGTIGHVAYIESVSGSLVTISEWNYKGLYKKTIRTLDISDKRIKGIIHIN